MEGTRNADEEPSEDTTFTYGEGFQTEKPSRKLAHMKDA
jgi:hypothetical protein